MKPSQPSHYQFRVRVGVDPRPVPSPVPSFKTLHCIMLILNDDIMIMIGIYQFTSIVTSIFEIES